MRTPAIVSCLALLWLPACSDSDADAGGSGGSAGAGASSSDGGATAGGSPSVGGAEPQGGGGAGPEGGAGGGGTSEDLDGDGIPQNVEDELAASYRPFLSVDESDACPIGGIVYRVRPHPDNAALIHIVYDHLFENDCGFNGHVGDNEAFGITVDPMVPAPAGIVSIVAIAHQGTPCESISTCGSCGPANVCDTGVIDGEDFPAVYSSKDKHGGYVNGCSAVNCFDSCTLVTTSHDPPMVNVGEPDGKLIDNLTTQGFITVDNGWTEQSLFDFDPWDEATDFGSAGNIAGDLVDPAFVPCAE